ncbi:hypothetical protein IFT48_03965 [Pseudomonas fluorescens]|uniref:hypothetical protein n=1 Tax=Pseudomonas fluorescens TaxID=294 RepID=UPI001930BD61|nr:hypothetical protein [Pseudomonas fluorescens]MBD8089127.1 hypothetical protein [Pseudomonas fluorescens]
MNLLKLDAIPTSEHQRHIVTVCQTFMLESDRMLYKVEDLLLTAEHLAESILAHYGSLKQASASMLASSNGAQINDKLPTNVLGVFLWASVREHPTLGIMLDELHDLYCDGSTTGELGAMQKHREDVRFTSVPRPGLFRSDGMLSYNPAAFARIHRKSFEFQVSAIAWAGAPAIERLLSQYPDLDAHSQKMLDMELASTICRSLVPDGDPVRLVMLGRIDDIQDAKERIKAMFACYLSNAPGSEFVKRRDHAFALLERMPREHAACALIQLGLVIKQWLEGREELEQTYQPVQCLVDVLNRASALGYDGTSTIVSHFDYFVESFDKLEAGFITRILEDLENLAWEENTCRVWLQAALVRIEDDTLLTMGLEEHQIAWFAHAKGSSRLREHLQKSSTGRDIVFGQDLGL